MDGSRGHHPAVEVLAELVHQLAVGEFKSPDGQEVTHLHAFQEALGLLEGLGRPQCPLRAGDSAVLRGDEVRVSRILRSPQGLRYEVRHPDGRTSEALGSSLLGPAGPGEETDEVALWTE